MPQALRNNMPPCFLTWLLVSFVPFLYTGQHLNVQLYGELLVPVPHLVSAQSNVSCPLEGIKYLYPRGLYPVLIVSWACVVVGLGFSLSFLLLGSFSLSHPPDRQLCYVLKILGEGYILYRFLEECCDVGVFQVGLLCC